jgi:hemoglobin
MKSRLAVLALLFSATPLFPSAACAQGQAQEEEASPAPQSLFDRMGGAYVLAQVVDDFVDTLLADPVVRANKVVAKAALPERKPGFKFQLTSLLCQQSGGPCKYEGRSLREAHQGYAVSDREWAAMMKAWSGALARAKVPAAERQELVNILDTAKSDIVTAPRGK